MEKLQVFYNSQQNVRENRSRSPSAGKPEKLINLLDRVDQVQIQSAFEPITKKDLKLAHDASFVERILNLEEYNGFGNKSREIAESLLWTNSSFFHAAEYAFINKTISMSPTSGFHHAEHDKAMMFCTFNGLMVTAIMLTNRYGLKNIGIIDFDAHYGNGTDDIIEKKNIRNIRHLSFPFSFKGYNKFNADLWLDMLLPSLGNVFCESEILLYQAGADPHIDDPLGGYLSTTQMRERDRIVFHFAEENKIPLVWNLAGGYQDPIDKVLSIHLNTVDESIRALR